MIRYPKWKRFWLSLLGLLGILIVNTVGLYGDGFIHRHYWVAEVEHFTAGLLIALLFSSFNCSKKAIFIWVAIFGSLWEVFEYAVVYWPALTVIIKDILNMEGMAINKWDTILDLILNFLGALLFTSRYRKEDN